MWDRPITHALGRSLAFPDRVSFRFGPEPPCDRWRRAVAVKSGQ